MKITLFIITLAFSQSIFMQAQNNIFPEWKIPKGVALVYPEKLPENPKEEIKKKELTEFYDSFIQLILNNSDLKELTIIHRTGMKEKLMDKEFYSERVRLIEIRYVQDIWLKDFAPICFNDATAFKTLYNPSYFHEKDKKTQYTNKEKRIFHYASLDDKVGFELSDKLQIQVSKLLCNDQQLILDGGNFIHNGKGIGITTNRIIADNETFSLQQIRDSFKNNLGINKLIIVPVEPGDETGHIDGMVRFIDEKTIVVASYPDSYQEGKVFLDNLANQLQMDFEVIRITNDTPKIQGQDKFPSAYGNYINYLRIGNTIFLPQYSNDLEDKDRVARKEYEKIFKVIPVVNDINKLAELGGVLNCITWTYY